MKVLEFGSVGEDLPGGFFSIPVLRCQSLVFLTGVCMGSDRGVSTEKHALVNFCSNHCDPLLTTPPFGEPFHIQIDRFMASGMKKKYVKISLSIELVGKRLQLLYS